VHGPMNVKFPGNILCQR